MSTVGWDAVDVPTRQAVRVEYPGYVRDMEAAVETLGGPQGLSKAAALGTINLPLKFRPGDSLCRPLFGEKCTAKGLLVKVSKKDLHTSGPISLEVVARVTSSYRFAAPSDFQFVADTSLPAFVPKQGGAGSSLEELTKASPQPLLTVPPLFSRNEDAGNYQYRSYYGADHPSLRAQGAGKVKCQLPPHVLKFAALKIPEPLKETDYVSAHYSPAKWQILLELRKLFAERPVWSLLALQERISTSKMTIDSELLAKVGYVFRSGPFLSLWIRRGYDPRKDQGSGKYQATVYTLPADWAVLLKHNPKADDLEGDVEDESAKATLPTVSHLYSDLCRFAAVPKQSAVLQLYDLQDLHVANIISQTSRALITCDKHTGWYDASVLERIEKRIQGRFQALLAKFRQDKDKVPPTTGDVAEAPSPMELDNATPTAGGSADDAADVPEHDKNPEIGAEGEGGIVPQEMLTGLLADWPSTAGEGTNLPTVTLGNEKEAGGGDDSVGQESLEKGDLAGEEEFLIFEASSSGSEMEDPQEQGVEEGEEPESESEVEEEESSGDEEEEQY